MFTKVFFNIIYSEPLDMSPSVLTTNFNIAHDLLDEPTNLSFEGSLN